MEKRGIAFGLHEYDRGDELRDFGREAAEALGLAFDQVFKTLLVNTEGGDAPRDPVVVVVHYPLFVKTPDEKENYYNIPPVKRMELLKLCEENGVVAFLAGHTHKLVVNEYKGIQLVNGETTSKNFDKRPLGFRVWHITDARPFRHEFVPLVGFELKEGSK